MRILMLSSVEYQSGSALRFRGLAGALARRGHDVHLLEPVPSGTEVETPPGVTRHECPRRAGRPEFQVFRWAWHGRSAVRRVTPQVCWTLKALPNVWWPALVARRRGARIAVDLDDLDWAYYPSGPSRSIVRHFFDRATIGADDVTVHNEPMREHAAGMRAGRSAPEFVDQGVEWERFAAAVAPEALRRELNVGDGPLLLYAGHLGPASDLGPLLPALSRVVERHPTAHLLVVGDGRERASLERIAAAQLPPGFVRFVGTVPHADVPSRYALADVALNYLEDTRANRFRASIKLREALAAGVPVVASDTPDAQRFASWARLAPAGGPDAFVDVVLRELESPDRVRAQQGRAWLAEHGTHDIAVRGIAERWEREVR